MILVTHDLGVVAETADEVAVMYAGRIVEQGPVAAVFEDPQHPYTIGLMGALPSLGRRGGRAGDDPGRGAAARADAEGLPLRHPLPVRRPALRGRGAAAGRVRPGPRRRLLEGAGRAAGLGGRMTDDDLILEGVGLEKTFGGAGRRSAPWTG